MATEGEKLYNAIQSGRVAPQSLNVQGKALLKSYLQEKNGVQVSQSPQMQAVNNPAFKDTTSAPVPQSNMNLEFLEKNPWFAKTVAPLQKANEWYEQTPVGKALESLGKRTGEWATAGEIEEFKPVDLLAFPLSFAVPGGGPSQAGKLGKLAEKATKLPGKVAPIVARGAAMGGALGLGEATAENQDVGETIKTVGREAAVWALLEMGGVALGAAGKAVWSKLPPTTRESILKLPKTTREAVLQRLNRKEVVEAVERGASEGEVAEILQITGPVAGEQKRLTAPQNFTFRDLTTEEAVGRVLPKGPKLLPEPERGFTFRNLTTDEAVGRVLPKGPPLLDAPRQNFGLQGEPYPGGYKATVKGPIETGVRPSSPVKPEDQELLNLLRSRNITLEQASKKVQQEYDRLVNQQVDYLQSSGGKGVEQGGIGRNPETGEVVTRQGRLSNNPKWYRDFYEQHGRAPRKGEYEALAVEQLRNGFEDDLAQIPPDATFQQVDALLGKFKQIQHDYPADIIKPVSKKDPLALPSGVNFTLEENPLQFKKQVIGPIEKGVAAPPPVTKEALRFKTQVVAPIEKGVASPPPIPAEEPLRFKTQVAVPRGTERQDLPQILAGVGVDARLPVSGAGMNPASTAGQSKISEKLLSALDGAEQAARERIKARKGRVLSGLPADDIMDYAIIGAVKMAKGTVVFAEWSVSMVKEYGEAVEPYLKEIYSKAKSLHTGFLSGEETITQTARVKKPETTLRRDLAGIGVNTKLAPEPLLPAMPGKKPPAGGLKQPGTAIDEAVPIEKVEEKIILSSASKKTFSIKERWNKFYENAFDSQNRLANISKDTKIKASNARQTQGIVDFIAENGLVNKEGKKIGEALTELVQGLPLEKETDFWRYMGHKHNVARAAEGKNVFSQFSPEDSAKEAQKILSGNPEFKQAGKKVTEWINKFMDNWTGDLVGEDTLKLWRSMYPDYFPVYRDVDSLAKGNLNTLPKRGFVNQHNLVKKAKGAKADLSSNIKDPVGNIIQLVNKTVKAAKNNEVGLSVLQEIRKGGLEDIFEIVPTKQGLLSDINKVLQDEGIEGVMAKFADQFDDVFRQVEKGNNIVKIMENGNEVLVKVKDLDYLKALQSLSDGTGQSAAELFERGARKVTRPIKDLITGKNPLFAAFNIMRDTPLAFIQGQENNPVKFAMRYFKALKEIAHRSEGFLEFVAQGGMQSGFFKSDVLKTAGKLKNPNVSAFEKFIRKVEAFNNLTEAAPRYMEYMATLEKGGTKAEGIYNAAEVTVNFARNGKWGKFFDSFVLYLNPALQGIDKFFRQVWNKPLQTSLKAAGVITAPQLIMDHVNKDNPNYQSLDRRTKDDFFLIPNKFGPKDAKGYAETFFRIPKAREYSVIFAVLVNRIGQLNQGKPLGEASKGVFGAIDRNFSVPVRPVWAPLTDIAKNKDWKNAPINPLGMELDNRSNYLKYDERTSEIGKVLAKLLNEQPIEGIKYSPKDIDYLLDSFTGIVGDLTLPMATKQESVLGVPKRKFIADSVYSNQEVTDFYDNLGKLRTAATDKNIIKGIPGAVTTKEEAQRNRMNDYAEAIGKLNTLIKQTSDEEKQREIRKKIVLLAGKGNKLYNSFK